MFGGLGGKKEEKKEEDDQNEEVGTCWTVDRAFPPFLDGGRRPRDAVSVCRF